jgi:sterol desaturase/sphingolipid hydroxylase (fatty acid hydroxylase superfamily)
MEIINIWVFVVAIGFGIAQHVLGRDRASLANGVRRWWTNGLIFAAQGASVTLFAAALTALTTVDTSVRISPIPITNWHLAWQVATLILVQGFLQYWLHRAEHTFALLWRWHEIHHSDKVLDATTGLRFHPLESLLEYLGFLITVMLLAPSASALIAFFMVTMAFTIFTHMDHEIIPARFDRVLAKVIVTPRLHNLHHSDWHRETDTNYGAIIVIWDRLFGTYLPAPDVQRDDFALGLKEYSQEKSVDPFLLLASPFTRLRKPRLGNNKQT